MEEWIKDPKRAEEAGEGFEREKLEREKASKKEAADLEKPEVDLEKFRARVEVLVEALGKVGYVLRRREEEDLSPIAEERTTSWLRGSINSLEESARAKDLEGIEQALGGIRGALDQIGHGPRPRVLREDSENLTSLIFALKETEDAILSIKSPELGEDLNRKLNSVSSVAQDKWLYVARRRDLIKAYEDRRY